MASFTDKALFRRVLDAIRDQKERHGSTSSAIVSHLKSQDNLPLPKRNLHLDVAKSLQDGVELGILLENKDRFKIEISYSPKKARVGAKKEKSSRRVSFSDDSSRASKKPKRAKSKAKRGSRKRSAACKKSRRRQNSLAEAGSSRRDRDTKEQAPCKATQEADSRSSSSSSSSSSRSRAPRKPRASKEKVRGKTDDLNAFIKDLVAEGAPRESRKRKAPKERKSPAKMKARRFFPRDDVSELEDADEFDVSSQTTDFSDLPDSWSAGNSSFGLEEFDDDECDGDAVDEHGGDVTVEEEEGSEVEDSEVEGDDEDVDVDEEDRKMEWEETLKENKKSSQKEKPEKRDDDDDLDGPDDGDKGDEIVEELEDAAEVLNRIPM